LGKFSKATAFTVLLVVLFIFSLPVFAAVEYPKPTDAFFVNDFANVLGESTERDIAALGKELESKSGAQVVLVTISTLDGEDIDSYANELFNRWGIGQKDKDNGILILNAVGERLLRIEVGYGLEGAVPDIKTAEIRERHMNPYLKEGDYDEGLYNGYAAVVGEVAKEYGTDMGEGFKEPQKAPSTPAPAPRSTKTRLNLTPFLIIGFLVFDGVLFRFRITAMLLRILFWSSFFRGGRGGRGGWGGGSGGWGGGGFGGSSGGGGRSGGGGSSGGY